MVQKIHLPVSVLVQYFCYSSIKIFPGTELKFKLEGTFYEKQINTILYTAVYKIRVVQTRLFCSILPSGKAGFAPSQFFPAGGSPLWSGLTVLKMKAGSSVVYVDVIRKT